MNWLYNHIITSPWARSGVGNLEYCTDSVLVAHNMCSAVIILLQVCIITLVVYNLVVNIYY